MARIVISGKKIVRETRTDKIAIHGSLIYRETIPAASGRIMSSLVSNGGLAGKGGVAGSGGGLAG